MEPPGRGESVRFASRALRVRWRKCAKIVCTPRVSLWIASKLALPAMMDWSLPLEPFGGTAPQRVAMLGPEEAEMAEFRSTDVRWRDGEDLRFDRRETRPQQFACRSRRPGIV